MLRRVPGTRPAIVRQCWCVRPAVLVVSGTGYAARISGSISDAAPSDHTPEHARRCKLQRARPLQAPASRRRLRLPLSLMTGCSERGLLQSLPSQSQRHLTPQHGQAAAPSPSSYTPFPDIYPHLTSAGVFAEPAPAEARTSRPGCAASKGG
jgi:hypothetical protein